MPTHTNTRNHQPCPDCGASDSITIYEDGSYCFSCGIAHRDDDATPIERRVYEPYPITLPELEYHPIKTRGYSKKTVEKYGSGIRGNYRWFPYYWEGELVGAKVKTPDESTTWVGAGGYVGLYGYQCASVPWALVITGGEEDAEAAYEMLDGKYSVVSIPFGSESAERAIKANLEWIESFEKVYICFDMDSAGQRAAKKAMSILKPGLGHHVHLPTGTQTTCDLSILGKRGKELMLQSIYSAKPLMPKGLLSAAEATERGLKWYADPSQRLGIPTGYSGLDKLIGGWRGKEITVLAAGTGLGKDLSKDAYIHTPHGDTTMERIQPGDTVYGMDGKPTRVVWKSDLKRPTSYRIHFDDGSYTDCCEDHEWVVSSYLARSSNRRRKTPQNILGTKTTKQMLTEGVKYQGTHSNWAVPLTQPVQYPERDLPLDPWLLGAWLGDGSATVGNITCHRQDTHLYDKYEHTESYYKPNYPNNCTISIPGLRFRLNEIGVLGNKRIPHIYLFSAPWQRLELLKGLMDTDGTVNKTGGCTFDNTNYNLAKGVMALVRSLGGKASMTSRYGTYNGRRCKFCYRVNFTVPFKVFTLPRKAERQSVDIRETQRWRYITDITPIDPIEGYCIAVNNESNTYLYDGYFVTHNSTLVRQLQYNLAVDASKARRVLYLPLEDAVEPSLIKLAEIHLGEDIIRANPPMSQDKLRSVLTHVSQNFIIGDNDGDYSIEHISKRIEYGVRAYGAEAVFLDHLTIVSEATDGSATDSTQRSMNELRRLANSLSVPIVVVVHLSRHQDDDTPALNRLKHSSAIAQVADCVLGLGRKRDSSLLSLVVLKSSRLWGEVGTLYLEYDKDTHRIEEVVDGFTEPEQPEEGVKRRVREGSHQPKADEVLREPHPEPVSTPDLPARPTDPDLRGSDEDSRTQGVPEEGQSEKTKTRTERARNRRSLHPISEEKQTPGDQG
jgi:replicative DNA helicase